MAGKNYPVSEGFHEQYKELLDQLVTVTLKDGRKITGGFADEFFEEETILINIAGSPGVKFIRIEEIERMEPAE